MFYLPLRGLANHGCGWQSGGMLFRTLLIIAAFAAFPALSQSLSGTASVIDGDTIEIHGQRIRLHAIDAPESRQTCTRGGRTWRCGREAALALADRIGRRPVTCDRRDIDRYGRVVSVCREGGEDLNAWMVRSGWALAYRRYGRDYIRAEAEAQRNRRGLWSGEFIAPWDWRRR